MRGRGRGRTKRTGSLGRDQGGEEALLAGVMVSLSPGLLGTPFTPSTMWHYMIHVPRINISISIIFNRYLRIFYKFAEISGEIIAGKYELVTG